MIHFVNVPSFVHSLICKAVFLRTVLRIGCFCKSHTQNASANISSLHFFKNKARTEKQL